MKPRDITRVVEIVDHHFGRWFHKVYDPKEAPALEQAKRAALREVGELKALLLP
jgi:hypothetical protein